MNSDNGHTIKRAIALLDCFTQDRPELGVREAARLMKISSSATGRLLTTLKDMGLLNQNPKTRTYSLGARVLTWAGVYSATLDVRTIALPSMQLLHQATSETISLYVIEDNERVCVERIESPQNVRIVARIGRRLPLYAGSAGKVLLAFLPDNKRDEILRSVSWKPLTETTISDPGLFQQEIDKIRNAGYALSHGEWISDASGVAAPIFDQQKEVIAALTISGPSQRFTKENVEKYSIEVMQVAAKISRDMGYNGNTTFRSQP